MNSREFLEKGLGKFYTDKEKTDFHLVFNLLLVYKKLRPCYLSFIAEFEEINQVIEKIYPGIFKFFRIYNTKTEKEDEFRTFIYYDKKPKKPNPEIFDNFRLSEIYIGEILDYPEPGALIGDIPNENKLGLNYHIYKNGKDYMGFHGFVLNHDIDDSKFLKKLEKICLDICVPGESYAVRKLLRTFIYLSKNWLSSLYMSNNAENNFMRRGEENGFGKIFLQELFNVYKENLEIDVKITKKEISLVSKLYPSFFIFTENMRSYKITKNTNMI